jgi:hypothetical protein
MKRTVLAFGVALVAGAILATGPASAARMKLSGSEIVRLLSGNSVKGEWNGSAFQGYFAADGTAYFQREGAEMQVGQWSAHEKQYCVTWNDRARTTAQTQGLAGGFDMTNSREAGDQDCFSVYQNFNKVIWVEPESGVNYTSVLVKGPVPNWQFDLPDEQASAQQ